MRASPSAKPHSSKIRSSQIGASRLAGMLAPRMRKLIFSRGRTLIMRVTRPPASSKLLPDDVERRPLVAEGIVEVLQPLKVFPEP